MNERETRVFRITASPVLLRRIERFLALLHFNSGFGHSGLFAMALDGDGSEKVTVEGLHRALGYEVEVIGGVGYDVEIAHNESYGGRFIDHKRVSRWTTGAAANLYKDGETVRTVPSKDWAHGNALGQRTESSNVAGTQETRGRSFLEGSSAMDQASDSSAQIYGRNAASTHQRIEQ